MEARYFIPPSSAPLISEPFYFSLIRPYRSLKWHATFYAIEQSLFVPLLHTRAQTFPLSGIRLHPPAAPLRPRATDT